MQREVTEPLYLDLAIPAGAGFAQALPASHNAFVYVYRGRLQIGGTYIPAHRMAILKNDVDSDGVVLKPPAASRALLIAGKPLGEPIAQYGPFVMNTCAGLPGGEIRGNYVVPGLRDRRANSLIRAIVRRV
jgi:redox-sensitive bicupin YhaK (pirin superfamily)